jgi:fructose-specific component phosphotransferase system IIB-like protein
MKTAVEWFAEVVAKMGYVSTDILEQAKEMEKEQIINAYNEGDIQLVNGEQYYKETFNK